MRDVIISGGVLALALVGAYVEWTSEETENTDETVAVYRAEAGSVSALAWRSEALTVEVEKKNDANGDYFWVTVTETTEEPVETEDAEEESTEDEGPQAMEPAPEGEDEPEEEAPEVETVSVTETVSFLGSDQAESLWTDFEPLQAVRQFTDADPTSAVFGLDKPTATVEVGRKSGTLALTVGGEAYGSKNKYVSIDGKVFMVDDKALRPLEFAKTRLQERSVQPNNPEDAETVTVGYAGQQRVWTQQNRDDRKARFWARQDAPTERDDAGDSWLSKVFRLRVAEYLGDAELDVTVEPAFTLSVAGEKGTWTVEVLREVEPQEAGEEPAYYAKTDFNRSMVRLSRSLAAEAEADLESLFDE